MGEFLAELIIGPILNVLFATVWWLMRTGALLLLYPLMLLTGWVRLWLREKGQYSLRTLWRLHGPAGLHQFGWAEATLDVENAIATGLIALAATGVGAVLVSLWKLWS